jgi:hypothetical protein
MDRLRAQGHKIHAIPQPVSHPRANHASPVQTRPGRGLTAQQRKPKKRRAACKANVGRNYTDRMRMNWRNKLRYSALRATGFDAATKASGLTVDAHQRTSVDRLYAVPPSRPNTEP